VRSVRFFGYQNGIIAGSKLYPNDLFQYIKKTTDAGGSWTGIGIDFGLTSVVFGPIAFHDFTHGFYVGSPVPGVCGSAYRTRDGGAHWDSVYDYKYGITGAFCVDTALVIMVSDSGLIVKSTDFGSSWQLLTSGISSRLEGVCFTSSACGYVIGAGGVVLNTINSGTSWSTIVSGTTNHLRGIHFPSSTGGFVVGDNGTILKIS
jgi:photosystem II stability/assembly factor-like uncharacterized protein